ncbi:MAG: T9SS type A sorting domain-containing protein, partial [Bacteroidota bacterium]
LGVPQRLHLTVYDTQGRLVADVLNAAHPSGRHQIEVDGSRWPAGVYFARLSTEAGEQTFKLVKV